MKNFAMFFLTVLTAFLFTFACAPDAITPQNTRTNNNQFPLGMNVSIIYLHHSTGGVIWGGNVAGIIGAYNASNSVNYQITERAYPSGDPYPWNNYPYDYWNIWINHAGMTQYMEEDTLELLTFDYDVIVFKHCYPVSEIEADSGTGDITSDAKTVSNYVLQYNALKTKMREFPDTRFIVWTGAAELQTNLFPEPAQRAHDFFQWVVEVWDEPGDNIFVWDFYNIETAGGMYLLTNYAEGAADNHPNAAFANVVAPYFCKRLIDVIRGFGDTTDIFGTNQ